MGYRPSHIFCEEQDSPIGRNNISQVERLYLAPQAGISPRQPHGHLKIRRHFGLFGARLQSVIGLPVHTLRFGGERFVQAFASTKLPPDLLGLSHASRIGRLLLACIGEIVAVPARKQFSGRVELRYTPPAIPPVGVDATAKPRPAAAVAALRSLAPSSEECGVPVACMVRI